VMTKLNFQNHYSGISVSHDPSEINLKWWFDSLVCSSWLLRTARGRNFRCRRGVILRKWRREEKIFAF